MDKRRFYEAESEGAKRSAPAALRNREPIADVLREWLPSKGLVLEIASGTGEHVVHFAKAFPALDWQPSDIDEGALRSIDAWRRESGLANIRPPIRLDVRDPEWGVKRADVIFAANMVHISPYAAAIGLLEGAARLLDANGSLILYGPWITEATETAPSNLAFDADLRRRNPEWGLRSVERFAIDAAAHGFVLADMRRMPAENIMLKYSYRNGCETKN